LYEQIDVTWILKRIKKKEDFLFFNTLAFLYAGC